METVTPEGDGMATFVLVIIMLVICWPTVITRCILRSKLGALGLDDHLMVLGLLMTTAWAGILIAYCYSGGGWDPEDERLSPEMVSRALKLYFICQSFYCSITIPIKVSICVALLRIAVGRTIYKVSLYGIIVVSTVAGISSMIGIIMSCSPPSAFWDPNTTGACKPMINTFFAYFISACSILTDFALAFLPAFMLWNVQLQHRVKLSVALILGLAAFASSAVIVRLKFLMALMEQQQFLLQSGKIAIWTTIELGIGIFAGSAPALRPLLRHIPFLSNGDTNNPSSYGRRTGPRKGAGQSHSHVKMSTFETGAFAESARDGKRDPHAIEDGDSQEFILQGQDGHQRMGIRKNVSVKVETSDAPEEWDGNNRPYY